MYISRKISLSSYSYRICESYYQAPYYRSKVLFDLGCNPEIYITYYSDVSFSIDLEEALASIGRPTDQFELEELFLRFLNPEAQRWVKFSLNKKTRKKLWNQEFNVNDIHWFDRIRLITLKLDHREPYRVMNHKFPFLAQLLFKSRDEIENFLWDMEDQLNYRERVRYLNAIFDLQKTDSLEKRDEIFLKKICEIAEDSFYYLDLSRDTVISNYLCRYIWQYFDTLPYMKVPPFFQKMDVALYQEIAQALNISVEVILNTPKNEILRLFRKKLLEVHPDKGGSHEEFIRTRKLMETFLRIRF